MTIDLEEREGRDVSVRADHGVESTPGKRTRTDELEATGSTPAPVQRAPVRTSLVGASSMASAPAERFVQLMARAAPIAVQRRGDGASTGEVHRAAARGVDTPS